MSFLEHLPKKPLQETALELHSHSKLSKATNPTAVGGEHATGFLQTLPSTFQANAAPGMTDISNPVDNAVAAINYIKSRYGSPANIPGLTSGNYKGY